MVALSQCFATLDVAITTAQIKNMTLNIFAIPVETCKCGFTYGSLVSSSLEPMSWNKN